jgi:hypothetical protein
MENLTLENYQDLVLKSVFAKAKKLTARDIEEVTPNKYVAYVDEEKESYDVAIEFEGKNVLDVSCDCSKQNTICVHKIALMNFIKSKRPEKKVIQKRKKTEADTLLEQLNENELRLWVAELFKKNKDIEFLFVNEFSKKYFQYTKEVVANIVDKAIKSVIKNKKNIDATELKRIIDALDVALAPVSKFCKENIVLPETNELFLFSNSILFEFHNNMFLNSIKLIRFIEKRYKEINLHVHSIQNKSQWEIIVDENIKYLLLDNSMYGMQMETVFHLYDSIDTKERRSFFASILFDIHTITVNKNIRYIKEIKFFFLKVFSENHLLEKVYVHFTPLRFENDYNLFLIEKLIEIEKYDVAENYAQEQIQINSNDKYNFGYFKLLKRIYESLKDEKKIALLQMKTIFHDFTLENYLLIEKYCEEKEFKLFRTKLLTAFKRNFYENSKYVKAYFEIFFHDKKFKNMIDNISERTSYELIYGYKEKLFLFDKLAFLIALTKIEKNSYFYFREDKMQSEYRSKFVVWIKEHYDPLMITTVIKSKKNYEITALLKALQV